jgi:hypothetical protein
MATCKHETDHMKIVVMSIEWSKRGDQFDHHDIFLTKHGGGVGG